MCHSLIAITCRHMHGSCIAVWFLEKVTLQFISLDQTAQTLIQWTAVYVASPRSMSTSAACSKCN